jgi:hypothetical protein
LIVGGFGNPDGPTVPRGTGRGYGRGVEVSRSSGLGADEIVDGWFDTVLSWGYSLDFLHSLEHYKSFKGNSVVT